MFIVPKKSLKQRSNSSAMEGYCFRGNRHAPNLWKRLLPSAKKKLVEAGLFTPEGQITALGMQSLKDME